MIFYLIASWVRDVRPLSGAFWPQSESFPEAINASRKVPHLHQRCIPQSNQLRSKDAIEIFLLVL